MIAFTLGQQGAAYFVSGPPGADSRVLRSSRRTSHTTVARNPPIMTARATHRITPSSVPESRAGGSGKKVALGSHQDEVHHA